MFRHIKEKDKKVLLLLSVMMVLIISVTVTLRSISDRRVVIRIGAEAISFIKIFFVFPGLIFAVLIYNKASQRRRKELNFYHYMTLYVAIILIFPLSIVPYQHLIHSSFLE